MNIDYPHFGDILTFLDFLFLLYVLIGYKVIQKERKKVHTFVGL